MPPVAAVKRRTRLETFEVEIAALEHIVITRVVRSIAELRPVATREYQREHSCENNEDGSMANHRVRFNSQLNRLTIANLHELMLQRQLNMGHAV